MKALKISLLILGILILGSLATLMFVAMRSPDRYLEDYLSEIKEMGTNKAVLTYPDDLLEKRTSLDARLKMSEDDSIGLRINLKDSAIFLEIKGIVLHRSSILEQKTSYFFRHLKPAEKYLLFHKPLSIENDESSIIKDRFYIKQAPKDTIEAQQNVHVPDTTQTEPVMYRLYLNHGIRVQIIGQLPDTIPQFWPKFKFEFEDRYRFLKALTNSLIKGTTVPYQPTIRIVINSREAESIYRAVPKRGKVILEF